MIGDLLGKLKDVQENMEASKKKLDAITVFGEAESGKVKVSCTANKKVTDITIDPELIAQNDTEYIQDVVMVAVNRALDQASKVAEAEMKDTAKGMMPNIPGLF